MNRVKRTEQNSFNMSFMYTLEESHAIEIKGFFFLSYFLH